MSASAHSETLSEPLSETLLQHYDRAEEATRSDSAGQVPQESDALGDPLDTAAETPSEPADPESPRTLEADRLSDWLSDTPCKASDSDLVEEADGADPENTEGNQSGSQELECFLR